MVKPTPVSASMPVMKAGDAPVKVLSAGLM